MRKSFDASFKAREKADGDGGTLVAYAATFDREPDSYGDVIARGAFKETLEKWAASDARIPLLFGHRTDDPEMNLGAVVKAEEDDRGLRIEAAFDPDNAKAQYARKLVREGRLSKMSFAFDVIEQGTITLEDGREANELRKVELFEVSLVPIPANQHADVIDVKALKPDIDDVDSKLTDDDADDASTADDPVDGDGDDMPADDGEAVDIDALAASVEALVDAVNGIGQAVLDAVHELSDKVDAMTRDDDMKACNTDDYKADADVTPSGAVDDQGDDEADDDADAADEVDDIDKSSGEKARAGELMSRMISYFD